MKTIPRRIAVAVWLPCLMAFATDLNTLWQRAGYLAMTFLSFAPVRPQALGKKSGYNFREGSAPLAVDN